MKTTRLVTLLLAGVLAACGGGGTGGSSHKDPVIALVSPANGTTISGVQQLKLTATGDGVDVKTFVFTAPGTFTDTAATFDSSTHTATLELDVQSMDYPDGILTVQVYATDNDNQQSVGTYQFLISTTVGVVTVDTNYASVYDEAGVQLGQSGGVAVVPAQYIYASTDKVVVNSGLTLNKIISRLSWSGTAPSAADLATNAYNLPVLRVLAPHAIDDPAIASAKAVVRVGEGSSVTVDLTPDTTTPPGSEAYLLPIATNLFPQLGDITTSTDITISVILKDTLNHSSTGGPWTFTISPLAPLVVATVDTLYSVSSDGLSVYPYTGSSYATLWTNPGGFALDNGVRVYHVSITNPSGQEVSLGASLLGTKLWGISESWAPHSTSALYYQFTRSCIGGGSGAPTCTDTKTGGTANGLPKSCSGTTNVVYQDYGTTTWSCMPTNYDTGPAAQSLSQTGTLKLTAYIAGTTSPATKTLAGRYVVPAAAGTNAGRVDLYVVRPITSDRGTAPDLSGNWNSSLNRFQTPTDYVDILNGCTLGIYASGSCSYYLKTWDLLLSPATESLSGSVTLDAQAYDVGQAAEYGPRFATPWSDGTLDPKALPSTITH